MDKFTKQAKELITFLDENPSPFHLVEGFKECYKKAGFTELFEGERFLVERGKSYFVTRNGSSIIAFKIPEKDYQAFHITAAHSDSPTLKLKPLSEITEEKTFVKLNVEKYGGMLMYPWFDRPLGLAGRVLLRAGERIESRLLHIDRDLLMIPSLAIHMNRNVNDGYTFNAQKDIEPVFAEAESGITVYDVVAETLGVDKADILDADLFLTNRVKGTFWGAKNEFIAAGRLDDIQCAYSGMRALTEAKSKKDILVHCIFDNEEVGSLTKQGASSTFLRDVLTRVNTALGNDEETYLMALAKSMLVSADNAHSVHPNYPEKADPTNRPVLNKGIVIKYSANQKYTTDAVSSAILRSILDDEKIPYQTFANRSDVLGGGTLGNLLSGQVSVNSVDIGLAQWAMHSPYESAGVKDTLYLIEGLKAFFETDIAGRYR